MAKEFAIDSNDNIEISKICPKNKKWNSETLKWETTTENIAYRHAEIKGKRVYCCIPSGLREKMPLDADVYSKSIEIRHDYGDSYDNNRYFSSCFIEFLLEENIQNELKKPKGGLNDDGYTYIPDPGFENKKYQDDDYSLTITVGEAGYSPEYDRYMGIYAKSYDFQNSDNCYFILGENIDSRTGRYIIILNLNHSELFHSGVSQSNFGSFILQPEIRIGENRFYNSNNGLLKKMKLTFSKESKNGKYNVENGSDSGAEGIGLGTINVYDGNGNILRELEVRNAPFKVEIGTDWATGEVGSLTLSVDGTSYGQLYVDDYPGMYIQYNLIYWNQDSDVYLEGYTE